MAVRDATRQLNEHEQLLVEKSVIKVTHQYRGSGFNLVILLNRYEDGDVMAIRITSTCDCCSKAKLSKESIAEIERIGFISTFSYTNDNVTFGDRTFEIKEVGPNRGYYPPATWVTILMRPTEDRVDTHNVDIYSEDE